MGSEPHVPGFDEIIAGLVADQDPDAEKRAQLEGAMTLCCRDMMIALHDQGAEDDPEMAVLVGCLIMFCRVGFPAVDTKKALAVLFPGESIHRIYSDLKEWRERGWQ